MRLNRKAYLMQRIQLAAVCGTVTRFVSGELDDEAAVERFMRKMRDRYETDLKPDTKSKRRRAGVATVDFWVYERPTAIEGKAPFWWVLLVSEGKGRVVEAERLIPLQPEGAARSKRLELDGYELVHDGVGWSWQMTRATVSRWHEQIRRICSAAPGRCDRARAEKLISDMSRAPGFRLVRRQVGHLLARFRGEWTRLRAKSEPMPQMPTFLPYVRMLPKSKRSER